MGSEVRKLTRTLKVEQGKPIEVGDFCLRHVSTERRKAVPLDVYEVSHDSLSPWFKHHMKQSPAGKMITERVEVLTADQKTA